MDTQNLARWIDELQGQIADLRIKVNTPAPEPVDKDVTPFLDLANKDYILIEADTEVVLTYDCFVLVDLPSTLSLSPSESAHAFTPIPSRCCYVKKGQVIQVELGTGAESGNYSLIPLFGGEQPPAPDPTPDVAPAADTRSTKKKK